MFPRCSLDLPSMFPPVNAHALPILQSTLSPSHTTHRWGPAHGGANEAVLRMLEEIGSPDRIPQFIARAKDKNDAFRLMGFGHRVYKTYDPRSKIMKSITHDVLDSMGLVYVGVWGWGWAVCVCVRCVYGGCTVCVWEHSVPSCSHTTSSLADTTLFHAPYTTPS